MFVLVVFSYYPTYFNRFTYLKKNAKPSKAKNQQIVENENWINNIMNRQSKAKGEKNKQNYAISSGDDWNCQNKHFPIWTMDNVHKQCDNDERREKKIHFFSKEIPFSIV